MIVRRTKFDRVRIYQTLRSAHLERARTLPPSSIFYTSQRYDFDPELARGLDLISVGALRMGFILATSHVRFVEINEPLMLLGVRRTVVALGALRLSSLLRRGALTIVSYAIENRDPLGHPAHTRLARRVIHRMDGLLARVCARQIDRIAYGTDAAQSLYSGLMEKDLASADSSMIPALPSPCDGPSEPSKDAGLVLFLGALVARKGLSALVAAWPLVTAIDGDIRLQIVGKGELEPVARELSEQDPTVFLRIDPPRHEIHGYLARARVLVLLSQPTARWREQVGLPIVEGLAHGCVIVTTTETGLANWLSDHDHLVVAPDAEPAEIASAIVEAVRFGPASGTITAALPPVDGRLAADAWLFGDQISGSGQDRSNGFSGSLTPPSDE